MTGKGQPPNKWVVLTMIALVNAGGTAIPFAAMPVLFSEVTKELDLTLSQVGTIWAALPLGIALFALPGGVLGDRFGFRKVIGIGCFAVALTNASRGISSDYITLAISMLFCGLSIGAIIPNLPKAVGLFFPSRQLGLALGVFNAGYGLGGMLATALGATLILPLVGSWRNVLFFYSAINVIIAVIWLLVIRETKPGQTAVNTDTTAMRVPFRKPLGVVLRVKDMWLLAIAGLMLVGAFIAVMGYLPLYLENIGTPKSTSDVITSTIFVATILGSITLPALSDRIGTRKIMLIVVAGVTAICTYLLSISDMVFFWVLIPLIGYFIQGAVPLILALPLEMKEIGPSYGGSAAGLLMASFFAGGALLPIVGGNLAELNQLWPFVFFAILVLAAMLCLSLVRRPNRR